MKKETSKGNLEKVKNIFKEFEEIKSFNHQQDQNYLNELAKNGFNAIHMAVLAGQEDLLEFFLEK